MRIIFLILFINITAAFGLGIQPSNYFQVDQNVRRGAALTRDNVDWLSEQGIKTIVKLDDENMDELNWDIPVKYFPINKVGLNISYKLITKILNSIDEASRNGPVYVHCEKGADRTGLIVALYRVKSGWTVVDARNEFNNPRFGHSKLQKWMDLKFEVYAKKILKERQTNN